MKRITTTIVVVLLLIGGVLVFWTPRAEAAVRVPTVRTSVTSIKTVPQNLATASGIVAVEVKG